jgi:catechol 2,3-dioxygenase-like lactoylglutathione lyase family enzyme
VAPRLSGIDHVAITVADLDRTTEFYDRLFGVEVFHDYKPIVRTLFVGGGVRLNVHQAGNGVELVAARPTPGSTDICFAWDGPIGEAVDLLAAHGVEIVDGPSPRETRDLEPSHSVYFHDPDGNLVELMAPDAPP